MITENANRLNMPVKSHPFGYSVGIFEGERRHLLGSSPVHDMHFVSAQPYSSNRCVNGGVSRTYDNYASGYSSNFTRFVARNKIKRICHSVELFPRNTKLMNSSESDPQKYGIMFSFNLSQPLRINPRLKLEIHSKHGKHIDLTQAFRQWQFVLGDPIAIQTSGKRTSVINIGSNTSPTQFRGASKRRRPRSYQCNRPPRLHSCLKWHWNATFI